MIIAIILLILRFFQRKGLCNSDLKAKSTTFVNNIKIEYNERKQLGCPVRCSEKQMLKSPVKLLI